jgi:ubiquitin-protein ligase
MCASQAHAINRLAKELATWRSQAEDGFLASPVDDCDLFRWYVAFPGLPNSPYEGGRFVLDVHFPKEYPFAMPDCALTTKIYHCNVYGERGVVCLTAVRRIWGPHITTLALVKSLQVALADPDPDTAMLVERGVQCRDERTLYDQTAREWVGKYAQGPLPRCLETQTLLIVLVSAETCVAGTTLAITCRDVAGEEILSMRHDPQEEVKKLYADLAKHLGMPWWQLSLVSQPGGREIIYCDPGPCGAEGEVRRESRSLANVLTAAARLEPQSCTTDAQANLPQPRMSVFRRLRCLPSSIRRTSSRGCGPTERT